MGRSERIKGLEIRNLVVKKLGVVGGFSSEVVASGVRLPMSAPHHHVIKEAIIEGDGSEDMVEERLHSSTCEDSRWGLHRRWGPSCQDAREEEERTGRD